MFFTDFEYDGICLSDLDCIVCSFGNESESIGANGEINFNLIKMHGGERFELVSSEYDDSLEFSFQICKDFSKRTNPYFTREESERLVRWLNRRQFHKFKILEESYEDLFFESSSIVKQYILGGRICGFSITMKTNSPHPYHEPVTISTSLTSNQIYRFDSISDEEGNIYPEMTIKVKQSGDLHIYNEYNQSDMYIKNCVNGETITVNYPMISTSSVSHKILNDFNYSFYAICNNYNNHENTISSTLPIDIMFTYIPIAKVGF